jgi:hypothetical protein
MSPPSRRKLVCPDHHVPFADPLDAWTVRALHLDLLGRPALESELEAWRGKGIDELASVLVPSEAFWQNWLEEQQFFFLLVDTFRPGESETRELLDGLHQGHLGVRAALHRILLCTSFDRRNPGPDTFVTVILEQVLGKSAQREARALEIGKRMYDGTPGLFLGARGNAQADVVRIAIDSPEALTHFLEREHRRLLRAEPDPRALAAWGKRLAQDELAYPALVREWLASPAYERRLARRDPMPNRIFVRALFVDLTGRSPEASEARRIRSALDGLAEPAPLRSLFARLLTDSKTVQVPAKEALADPEAWIRGLFERLLGRPASADELATFVASLSDAACTPRTVLYAIVTHPFYATW